MTAKAEPERSANDMVQLALGRDDTGPVELSAVEPNSVADLWPHWNSKTPAPEGQTAKSPPNRRFWSVTMWYADGVELHFTPGIPRTPEV